MFCPQCGKQITDDAAFCPMCGAATGGAPTGAAGAQVAAQAPVAAPASTPQPQVAVGQDVTNSSAPKKRSKKPLVIGVAAVVIVAAIGVGVAFATGAFNTLFAKTLEGTWDISIDYTDSSGSTTSVGDAVLTVGGGSWTCECENMAFAPYDTGYSPITTDTGDGVGYTLSGSYTQSEGSNVYTYAFKVASYELSDATKTMMSSYAEEDEQKEVSDYIAEIEQGFISYAADYDVEVSVSKDGVGSDFPAGEWSISGDDGGSGGNYNMMSMIADISSDGYFGLNLQDEDYSEEYDDIGTWELVGDTATFTVQFNSDSPQKVVVSVKRT